MPLYEVLCVSAHAARYVRRLVGLIGVALAKIWVKEDIHSLVRQSAMLILNNGGVVRSIRSWGTRELPRRIVTNKVSFNNGE